jgi:hypothetical protein
MQKQPAHPGRRGLGLLAILGANPQNLQKSSPVGLTWIEGGKP